MKDITRIHIAKVPYNIELSAKKELENYINALEAYTADNELLQDIEIRITELLLERDVKEDDVISSADVAAIREQLGEPKEFMTDEASDSVDSELLSKSGVKKLYRNTDIAIIGGVLGGVAEYLGVNALWIRLTFIILTLISAGLFIPLYLVAWLIIPPARSAAEKLQMAGRPVTLASIRELNETSSPVDTERRRALIVRIFTTVLGLGAIGVAISAAALMTLVTTQLIFSQDISNVEPYSLSIILMFASGVLLIALSLLVAVASFAQKFNKRIWVSALIISILGLLAFTVAIGAGIVQERTQRVEAERNMVEKKEKLPGEFSSVTSLNVDIPNTVTFTYIVDPAAATIKQRIPKNSTQAEVTITDKVATVSIKKHSDYQYGSNPTITIYGPSLSTITAKNGSISYSAGVQQKLKIEAHNTSSVSLVESRVDELSALLNDSAQFSGDDSSISSVILDITGGAGANLGNIKSLGVKSPEACGLYTTANVTVQSILNTTYDYNGKPAASRSAENPCYTLTVSREDMDEYEY